VWILAFLILNFLTKKLARKIPQKFFPNLKNICEKSRFCVSFSSLYLKIIRVKIEIIRRKLPPENLF